MPTFRFPDKMDLSFVSRSVKGCQGDWGTSKKIGINNFVIAWEGVGVTRKMQDMHG